jgi:hypothetical protein
MKNKKPAAIKTATKALAPKKALPKKAAAVVSKTVQAKGSKKAETKVKLAVTKGDSKLDKKSATLEIIATEVSMTLSEDEEEEKEASASSSNAAGLAVAAAAATASADAAAGSLKNFRHHPDIENFYRFIFENDLRYEALEFIDVIVGQRTTQKSVKLQKAKAH